MACLFHQTGWGRTFIILVNKSSIPKPVFADTNAASWVSIPKISSICSLTFCGSDEGKSILFSTGRFHGCYL